MLKITINFKILENMSNLIVIPDKTAACANLDKETNRTILFDQFVFQVTQARMLCQSSIIKLLKIQNSSN